MCVFFKPKFNLKQVAGYIFFFYLQEGFAPPDEVEGGAGDEDEYWKPLNQSCPVFL